MAERVATRLSLALPAGAALAAAVAGTALARGHWVPAVVVCTAVVWAGLALRLGAVVAGLAVVTLGLPLYDFSVASLAPGLGLFTVVVALLTLAVAAAVYRTLEPRELRVPELIPVVAFSALLVVSLVTAPRGDFALETVKGGLARGLVLPLAFVGAFLVLERRRQAFAVLGELRLVLLAVAVAGGVLSVVQMAFNAGYVHPPGEDAAGIAAFVGERATGLSEHPNTWAAFLILPAGLALASLVARPRLATALVLLLITVSIGLTASRAGWIAITVMLLVAGTVAGRRVGVMRALLAVPVVLAAAALAIGLGALQRAPDGWRSVGRDASTTFRVLLGKAELELGRRHPVRGIGVGNIGVALAELPPDSLRGKTASGEVVEIEPRPFADRHNVYLGLFAELGVLGPLLFAAVLVSAAVALARIRGVVADRERELVDGLLLALLGSAIVAMFIEADREAFLWWVVSCALGIGAATRVAARRRAETT